MNLVVVIHAYRTEYRIVTRIVELPDANKLFSKTNDWSLNTGHVFTLLHLQRDTQHFSSPKVLQDCRPFTVNHGNETQICNTIQFYF